MYQVEIHFLADDPRVLSLSGTYKVRCQFECRVIVEVSRNAVFRQLDAIALNARKTNFKRVSLRPHCFDMNGFSRWLWWRNYRLSSEVKRNPQHIGVFHVEYSAFVTGHS